MQEECPTLKYGDIIQIHGVNISNKDSTQGLIISKGFTDSNIYYQKYSSPDEVNFYRQSLFQILPRSNFQMHDQLLEENLPPAQRQNIKNRAPAEVVGLENMLKSKAGQEVKYGNSVVFRHVESQSYLRGILKAADTGEGAFRVEVEKSLSSQVVFKLTSHRSYEHDDDKIYYDDPLQIYHPKSDCFTNFAEDSLPIYLDQQHEEIPIPEDHHLRKWKDQRPLIKSPKDYRISVINENKSKCLWKFIQHCSYEEYNEKQSIKPHDIVYFMHTKEKGLVSSTLDMPIKNYLKEHNKKIVSYDCFWELIPKPNDDEFGSFFARNSVTGQMLCFQDTYVEIKPDADMRGFCDGGRINLTYRIEDREEKLDRGERLMSEESEMADIIRYYEQSNKKYQFKSVTKMTKDIFTIHKVGQDTMRNFQYAISSHEPLVKFVKLLEIKLMKFENQPEDDEEKPFCYIFKDWKEDNLDNMEVLLKMLTGKIYDSAYQENFDSAPNPEVQKIMVETGITQLLMEIINLLFKPTIYMFKKKNEPNEPFRPVRTKMENIFSYTYKLLEKIAIGSEENRIYLSRWVDVFLEHGNNINKPYIQECLVGILQNNPKCIEATINEQKIIKLIDSFFSEIKGVQERQFPTKYLRLFSTFIKCQNRVLKQNQNIILKNFFKNRDNPAYFRFKIEEKISEEEPPKIPGVSDKVLGKQVLISFGKSQFSTIAKFYRDWEPKWNYFMAFVTLLADVCMDRNSDAIVNLNSLLPLQTVTVILFDKEIEQLNQKIAMDNGKDDKFYPITNVHEPFIRIAHYAHINNEQFLPIKRIIKISEWYGKQDHEGDKTVIVDEEVNITKREFNGEKEDEEKRYLNSIMVYIKNFLKACDQKEKNLTMLHTVLNLLKETVLLGLWYHIQDYREIIPQLLMRIIRIEEDKYFHKDPTKSQKKTPDEIVKDNKKLLLLNRADINLSIECKVKAVEIIGLINELQIDIRLRYVMKFFKGLYETTEDFNSYDFFEKEILPEDITDQQKQNNQLAKKVYNEIDSNHHIFGGIAKVSEDQEIILKENVWYNKLKQITPFSYKVQDIQDGSKNRYLYQGAPQQNVSEEFFQQQFKQFVLSLFELPIYEKGKLMNSSILMLKALFQQRKALLSNLKTILICGKGNLNEVYLTLKYMREKFNVLNNFNIIHYEGNFDPRFTYPLNQTYDYTIKAKQMKSGIIQDLFFLTRTLKENISLKNMESLMHVDPMAFHEEHVYNYMNEREKNNELFQAVNLAEGIYIPLIKYLQIMKNEDILPENHRQLLCSIFQYLTLLCFSNLEAKQTLMEYIPDILPFLKKKVGAAAFICEICKNNKLLVNNEELVELIIDVSLDSCMSFEQNLVIKTIINIELDPDSQGVKNYDYEKSLIFNALRGIVIYKDEGHKRNQQILMNKLTSHKYQRLIFKDKFEFRERLNNYALSPEQAYVAYHFQLFSFLVESKNMINIGKLENIHPYPHLLECMKNTNRWQIRRALRAYVNRLYYTVKDKEIFLFEEFIRKEFDILNQELHDLIDIHKNKMIDDEMTIKNGIRFYYAESQIHLMMLEIFISLNEMFLKPKFKEVLLKALKKEEKYIDANRILHEKIIRVFKFIGCLNKLYSKNKPISSFIREIKNVMSEILLEMENKYLAKKAQPDSEYQKPAEIDQIGGEPDRRTYVYDHSKSFFRNLSIMIRELKAKKRINELKQKMKDQGGEDGTNFEVIQNIFSVPGEKLKPFHAQRERRAPAHENPHLQTASSRIFKVLAKPELNENQENLQLNKRLQTVKKLLEESPVFSKFKEDEFYKLVQIFINLDNISTEFYDKAWTEIDGTSIPVVKINEVLTKTISLIISEPQSFQDEEKIFIIRLIRCYITESVEEKQNYKLPIDQWEPSYYDQSEEEKRQLKLLGKRNKREEFEYRQSVIENCGGSQFIRSILLDNLTNRIELLNQIMLMAIAYLFGGNKVCQDSILKCLMKDENNEMLLSLRNMIKQLGYFLIESRKIKQSDQGRKFAYCIVDTYDYYSMQEHILSKNFNVKAFDKTEIEFEMNNEYALCRTFRFMQLLCESNNVPMKKFITKQININQTVKINSINFIEEACLLMRNIFKIMNQKTVSLPPYIMNFLGEVSQVPCIDNQISFIKSTFFEDLSYMATFLDKEENRRARKFPETFEEGQPDQMAILSDLYDESIKLALTNFEGRDPLIISQFLNKCQPSLVWIVLRNNIWGLLTENYGDQPFVINEQGDPTSMDQTFQKLDEDTLNFIIEQEKKYKQTEQGEPIYMFQGRITNILNILIIFKHIKDWIKIKQGEGEGSQKDAKKGNKFIDDFMTEGYKYPNLSKFIEMFSNLLFQIQISMNNGSKTDFQYIYFPSHPIFSYLAPATRDNIMMQVIRGTQRDKLTSLLSYRQQVYTEIESNYKMNYNKINFLTYENIPAPITSGRCQIVRKYARNCSYIICVFLLLFIFVDHDIEEQSSSFVFDDMFTMILLRVLCFVQLMLTLAYCYLWGKMRSKLALTKYHKTESEEEAEGEGETVKEEELLEKGMEEEGWVVVKRHMKNIFSWLSGFTSKITSFFTGSSFYKGYIEPIIALYFTESGILSLTLFVIASFLGNFYGIEWYTIHLFDFFASIPLLSNVFKSLLIGLKQLLTLTLLATAFILVFNVLSFSTYTSVIYEEDLPSEACEDILTCVLELYTSGAIGDDMDEFVMDRFVFDIVYVVFMELLFSNLVGGIMIDGYTGLSAADSERDEDKKGKCYICSMTKANMQKIGDNFTTHTKMHWLWNYLFYIYIIQHKDSTDFTGIECEISNQISKDDVLWFPAKGEDDVENPIEDNINILKEKLEEKGKSTMEWIKKSTDAIDKAKQTGKKKRQAIKEAEEALVGLVGE